MNILLDTHALLWALHAPGKLTRIATAAIRDPRNAVYVSVASVWEIEIKSAKGKLTVPADWLDAAEQTGFIVVPITAAAAAASARLPWRHADPFDRLLVAVAIENDWRIATRDQWVAGYDVPVLAC